MELTSLVAVALLGGTPIQFDVKLSKTVVRPGEPMRVELLARNVSKQPVVLAKAIWDGAPAAGANAALALNGKEVRYEGKSSMSWAQVQVSNRVDANRFVSLQPGQSTVLYWTTIEKAWDFGSSTTRMKEDYARATKHDLRLGSYSCTVSYSFEPDVIARRMKQDWDHEIRFEPGAEALWKSAVTTKFSATRQFEVRTGDSSSSRGGSALVLGRVQERCHDGHGQDADDGAQ